MIKLLIFFLLIFSSCTPFKRENIVEKKSKEVIKEINSEKIQITQNFNSDLEIKLPNRADNKSRKILRNNLKVRFLRRKKKEIFNIRWSPCLLSPIYKNCMRFYLTFGETLLYVIKFLR